MIPIAVDGVILHTLVAVSFCMLGFMTAVQYREVCLEVRYCGGCGAVLYSVGGKVCELSASQLRQ